MPAPVQPTEENINRRLVRLDYQIKVEYDLIGHRIGWLLVSNSFVIAAYVILLTRPSVEAFKTVWALLAWILPAVGLISCAIIGLAVTAAHTVIADLKAKRDPVEEVAYNLYGFEKLGVRTRDNAAMMGDLPPRYLPFGLGAAWFVLFIMYQMQSSAPPVAQPGTASPPATSSQQQ